MSAYKTCDTCIDYAERRSTVLIPAMALASFRRGIAPAVVLHEFMFGVHRRHLAGYSLSPTAGLRERA